MTTPSGTRTSTDTPNRAVETRPSQSSKRVARKAPLAWLPWALLGLLGLLVAASLLLINAIDDDGPDGPRGDTLGQAGSDGSGIDGADGNGQPAGAEGDSDAGANTSGGTGDLAGLTAGSLVGGAGVAPAPASANPTTAAKREPGTAGTVLFAEGSAELDRNAQQVIAQAVEQLKAAGAKQVTIAGFTDVIAGEQVNDPLSQQRADAVASVLKRGLPGVQIRTQARGQESPVAPNTDEAGRQQNRRASIVATG